MKVAVYSVAVLVICLANYSSGLIKEIYLIPDEGGDKGPVSKTARQCGGPGQFVEMRWTGCEDTDADDDDICEVSKATTTGLQTEIDYIPAADLDSLRATISCSINGGPKNVQHDGEIRDSKVELGKPYTIVIVHVDVDIPEQLVGKDLKCTYEIKDSKTGQVRICTEEDIQVRE